MQKDLFQAHGKMCGVKQPNINALDAERNGILFSGGVESVAMLLLIQQQVPNTSIYFCSTKFTDRRSWEHELAIKWQQRTTGSTLCTQEAQETTFNAEEIERLIEYTRINYSVQKWFIGHTKYDVDRTISFRGNLILKDENILSLKKHNIFFPFWDISKEYILKIIQNINYSFLSDTHSCHVSTPHCGRCSSCIKRQRAFKAANIKDVTIYIQKEK